MAAADRRRWRRRYDACRPAVAAAAAAAMVVSLGGATVELPPQFDWRHRPAPTAVVTLRGACVRSFVLAVIAVCVYVQVERKT